MTGHENARARFVRARQRDHSSSLVGFATDLSPILPQVGVDAIRVNVSGQWHSDLTNGRSLFENALHLPEVNWFNQPSLQPSHRPTKISVEMSRTQNTSTINECKITAWQIGGRAGNLEIALRLNPTRTLAHLIARFEHERAGFTVDPEQGFAELIEALSPSEFFLRAAQGRIAPSLSGSDNYLPSHPTVRGHLGDDFWSAFLPIYVQQVRGLCVALLSQLPNAVPTGATDHIVLENGRVHLDWGQVRVPQIECYFERYHTTAVQAVRRGGWAILSADHSSELRWYSDPTTFARDNDRFTIGLPLSATYVLAIYAKRDDRIRFEVRRKKKGNYSTLEPPQTPTMRLSDIIEQERANLLAVVRWDTVGELLAGPDHPDLHDLAELIEQVAGAVEHDARTMATLLTSLLLQGSISGSGAHLAAVNRLVQRGVLEPEKRLIERGRIRRRDINNRPVRYVLSAPYRDIHMLLADPLG